MTKAEAVNRLTREIHKSLDEAKQVFEKDFEGIDDILNSPRHRLSYYKGWMKSKNIETMTEIDSLIELIIKEYNE